MIPKSRIYPVLYRETTSRKKKHVTDEIGAGNGVQKMFYIPRKKKIPSPLLPPSPSNEQPAVC
jgi:hypothetical protein